MDDLVEMYNAVIAQWSMELHHVVAIIGGVSGFGGVGARGVRERGEHDGDFADHGVEGLELRRS